MSDTRHQPAVSIATEAADWYARLSAPDVSELEAVRFRAWLAADPARRAEFEAIDTLWADLAAIDKSAEVLRIRAAISARRRASRWWHSAKWSIAATLVAVIGAGWLAWQQWGSERYVTDVGKQRTVPLADGSIVMLNTDTEVKLHFSEAKRGVELVRGQANFEVAKDPSRPFIVTAGGGEVRAVGTVFDVYKAADKVTVTLIEGKVAVTGEGGHASGEAREIILAAGEQLSYATRTSSVKRAAADVPRVTAWRARKLDFSDTPILEAIAEANRYSRDQIVLEAPALKDARISGTFEAGKNELLVEGLQTYFRLNVERSDDHRIVLSDAH